MMSQKNCVLALIGLLVLVSVACVPVFGGSGGPVVAWNITLESRIFDEFYDIVACSGTSYLLLGSSQDYNRGHYGGRFAVWEHGGYHWGRDISLTRIGADGTVLWTRKIGKPNDDCIGFSIEEASDGMYFITGEYRIGEADWDVRLIKVDAAGRIQWMKHYGGLADDWAMAGCITRDGAHIMAGGTASYGAGGSDVYVIKTNQKGEVVWEKVFGGPQDEWATSVCPAADGDGVIVVAETSSFGSGRQDLWIFNLDADGNVVWETVIGGGQDDWPSCVAPSEDGGYIIAGGTKSFGSGKSDVFLVKIDAHGIVEWQQALGGSEPEWANDVVCCSGGGYCLAGVTLVEADGKADVLVLKVTSGGEQEWELHFGGTNGDWANALIESGDWQYVVVGALTREKLVYQEKIENRIKYLADNGYYLSRTTSSNRDLYGQVLAAKIVVPETVPGVFEGGWDENVSDEIFWDYRIPVFLHEPMQINRTGVPVILTFHDVFGTTFNYSSINPASVRVIDPLEISSDIRETGGISVPFTIYDEDADGTLSNADYLIFRSDVPAGCNKTYYVYYSKDPAIAAPDHEPLPWNLLENAGLEDENEGFLTGWTPFSSGYSPVLNKSHSGAGSLYMHVDNSTAVSGASQWVVNNATELYQSLTFVAWVSGEDIAGTAGNTFALHPVLVYADGNKSSQWYAHLNVGTSPWQRYAIEITPSAPVRQIGYYLLFINHPGSVWFDAAEIFGNVYSITCGAHEKSVSQKKQDILVEGAVSDVMSPETPASGIFSEPLRSQDLFLLVMIIITLSFIIVVFSLRR